MKWPLLRGQCCQRILTRTASEAQALHRVTLKTWVGAAEGQPSEEEEVAEPGSHLTGKEAWCCVSFLPSNPGLPGDERPGGVNAASRILTSLHLSVDGLLVT